jgi:predicted secreted protein
MIKWSWILASNPSSQVLFCTREAFNAGMYILSTYYVGVKESARNRERNIGSEGQALVNTAHAFS